MTVVAGIAAGDMRRVLADRNDAVMAGGTGSQYLRVINSHHGREQIGGMAVFADIRCLNVVRVLTDRLRAVVTTDTVARDIQVIEVRRQPANRAVTIVTGIAAGDMRRVLANGNGAIVAGDASPDYLGVIDGQYWRKNIRRVTVFADVRCLNVRLVLANGIRAVMAAGTIAGDIDVIEIRR